MSTDTKRSIILSLIFFAIFITTYKFYMLPRTLGDYIPAPIKNTIAKVTHQKTASIKKGTSTTQADMLTSLWQQYKDTYIDKNTGRTIDPQYNITTSEGQSYAMLRAVWMNDQETFVSSWQWTRQNLQHTTNDNLFSWKYGKHSDGTLGVLTSVGGQHTATDADTDIAVALLFAAKKWDNPAYAVIAQNIVKSVWENEVVTINGTPYLVSNNVEKNNTSSVLINPSYLSPYAYRMFAEIDSSHPWQKVVDSSYAILDQNLAATFTAKTSAYIPSDWISIDRKTGAIHAPSNTNTSTNFGYDAFRTIWRITLDKQWYGDPRADALLAKMNFFNTEYSSHKQLKAIYAHDGSTVSTAEAKGLYGGVIGYFMTQHPDAAKTIFNDKIAALVDNDAQTWKGAVGYYDSNWLWFGAALYQNKLPNLSK